MTRTRKRFRPRPLATLLVLALGALLVALGVWQLHRAQDKRELLARFDGADTIVDWRDGAPPPRYSQVRLRGRWLQDRQILLEGYGHNGRPGLQVLTPLLRADGEEVVLVNRGWVPWRGDRASLPALPAPAGTVQVEGRVAPFPRPGLRLGDADEGEGTDWPRLAVYPDAQRAAQWLGLTVAERIVLLDPAEPDGFVREWRPAQFPPSRHVGYAVQWFSLAAALAVLFWFASREEIEE